MFGRGWIIIKHTYLSYVRDNCGQLAASISYYILFSVVPLAILIVSIFGLVLTSKSARQDVVDQIVDTVPFSDTEGRQKTQDAVDAVNKVSGPFAALGVVVTIWSASAVFASVRKSLNTVWDVTEHRPFFQAKLVDFLQIGMLLLVLVGSIIATAVIRAARTKSAEQFGPFVGDNPLWELPGVLLPATLTFAVFLLLYRFVPAARPRWTDVLPGALVATVAFEALKNLFAIYAAHFTSYDVVYGSLAGVLLFTLFMFLAASILLIGAELSRTWQRYRAGAFELEMRTPQPPVGVRIRGAMRSLFLRDRAASAPPPAASPGPKAERRR